MPQLVYKWLVHGCSLSTIPALLWLIVNFLLFRDLMYSQYIVS